MKTVNVKVLMMSIAVLTMTACVKDNLDMSQGFLCLLIIIVIADVQVLLWIITSQPVIGMR